MEIALIIVFIELIVIIIAAALLIKPLRGILSISNYAFKGIGDAAEKIGPVLNVAINSATTGFASAKPVIHDINENLNNAIESTFIQLANVLKETGSITNSIMGGIGYSIDSAFSSLGSIAPLANQIVTAGFKETTNVLNITGNIVNSIVPFISDATVAVMDSFNQGVITLGSITSSIGGNISNVFTTMNPVLSAAVSQIGTFLDVISEGTAYIVEGLAKAIEAVFIPINLIGDGVQTLAETVSWIIDEIKSIISKIESIADPGGWF